METKITHAAPDGSEWNINVNSDGTFTGESEGKESVTSKAGRSEKQFLADIDRKNPAKAGTTEAKKPKYGPVSGDWETDKLRKYKDKDGDMIPYAAHWIPPTPIAPGYFDGPDDAYLFFGQPWEGDPIVTRLPDPNNDKAMISVQPFLDTKKISAEIGGVKLKWIAWDKLTGCNVYERLND